METVKSRETFLDLLRIIACFLVIVNHTNSVIFLGSGPDSFDWYVSLTYFFISKIAVPIFFIISGYLLLKKEDDYKKIIQRILRIVIALVACGLIYSLHFTFVNPDPSFQKFFERFVKVYYVSPSNALWYLYAYLGILIMLPFIQKMTASMQRIDYHIFFGISAFFVSVLPILSHYIPELKINSYFQLPLFGGYICMLLIGRYFSKFEIKKTKCGFFIACAVFVIMTAFNVVATYFEYQKKSSGYLFFDNRVFLPILLQSVCVFYMASFAKFSKNASKAISYIGSCTFGIYLLSDLGISLLRPAYQIATNYMHPIFAVVIFEIAVFLSGLAVVTILKKIPYVKKII